MEAKMIRKEDKQKILRARNYLMRYDKILEEMEPSILSVVKREEITKYYISCMMEYYKLAIFINKIFLEYMPYQKLSEIARKIIEQKEKTIEQMKEIEKTTIGYFNSEKEVEEYTDKYIKTSKKMIYKIKNSYRCPNINLDYINELIPYCEGEKEVNENVIKYSIDPRLKEIAEKKIIKIGMCVDELNDIRKYM
jgi:uncharacterized protein (DUF305 family)